MDDAYVNLDRFRALVEERFGLALEDHPDHLGKLVRQRMRATGCRDFGAYELLLAAPGDSHSEFRAVAELLTVGETYFFRNRDHFRALVENALPDRLRQLPARRPVRILSVGCASGEEAYTIAILLREHFPHVDLTDFRLKGIDVNPAAVARAERARYTPWSLRETPEAIREKYFRSNDGELILSEEVRAMVSFEERNVFDDDVSFWAPGSVDIVFFRNVVIYFGPERVSESIARVARALVAGGFLFLGHSESLRGMTDDFDLLHTHDTFYYRRRDPLQPKPGPSAGSSWMAPIERASLRVEQLTSRPPPPASHSPDPVDREALEGAGASVELATELYRQERFAEALNLLTSLPAAAEGHPDVLLLEAAILTNQGDLERAEAICNRLLAVDGSGAGAHYLLALARERAGDLDGALRHDQMALYFDATFAMAHLHMGMLARHAGDYATARRELSHAVTLLAREEGARIILFGGGFSRDALTRLCRTELEAAGGRP